MQQKALKGAPESQFLYDSAYELQIFGSFEAICEFLANRFSKFDAILSYLYRREYSEDIIEFLLVAQTVLDRRFEYYGVSLESKECT